LIANNARQRRKGGSISEKETRGTAMNGFPSRKKRSRETGAVGWGGGGKKGKKETQKGFEKKNIRNVPSWSKRGLGTVTQGEAFLLLMEVRKKENKGEKEKKGGAPFL